MERDVKELFDSMDLLMQLHDRLIAALDQQLAAARAANVEAMRHWQQQTEQLVRQIAQAEAERRIRCGRLAERAGLSRAEAQQGVTVTRLAAALPEASRSQLLRQAARLRSLVEEADRLNKILAEVSRRILLHLKAVYESVADLSGHIGVYARDGRLQQAKDANMFETVG